jgi:predicted AAA+ superfamily ATPase
MERAFHLSRLDRLFRATPVVAILGPRQCGKTTLARQYAKSRAIYFDLENPRDLQRLDQPFLALEGLEGLVVIDEIQRSPGLFKALRVLVDRPKNKARYLIRKRFAGADSPGFGNSRRTHFVHGINAFFPF